MAIYSKKADKVYSRFVYKTTHNSKQFNDEPLKGFANLKVEV